MTTLIPTLKSTKAELLAAFEDLRREYENAKAGAINPAAERRQETMILERTATATPAAIEKELMELRRKVQEEIDRLGQELTAESAKLGELREAIAVAGKQLQETRHIELTADTLDALMADYARTEKELAAKRQQATDDLAAEMSQRTKEREREQEEYAYNLKIERRKEQDANEAEMAKRDAAREEKFAARTKTIDERDVALKTREDELTRLQAAVNAHPNELETVITMAETRVTAALKKDFETERKLADQEHTAEKNMLETRLTNALEIIKTQTTEITSLKKFLEAANDRAQSLAATVIESVSGAKQMKMNEVAKE